MREPSEKWVNDRMCRIGERLGDYANKLLDDKTFRQLCDDVAGWGAPLKWTRMPGLRNAIRATLDHLKGAAHAEKVIRANVLRVYANWHFVKEDTAIPMWDGSPETMSMVVIGVKRLPGDGGRQRYMLLVKLKSGLAAGIIQCTVARDSVINGFLAHDAGVARYNCATEEIAGMRFKAVVEALPDGSVKASDWKTNDSMRKHNKDLAERRSDPAKCMSQVPCNVCSRTVRECPLAVWLPERKEK